MPAVVASKSDVKIEVPADATTFRNLLRRVSVGMQPEGLAGMTNGATPSREAVYISKRKGFIRIAIQVKDAVTMTAL